MVTAIITAMAKPQGKIIIGQGVNAWPHELKTAQAIIALGKDVEFIRWNEEQHATSADRIIGGLIGEMKAPKSSALRRVQRTLRDAVKQSRSVIFDSRRMKGVPDKAIERELRMWAKELKSLDRLWFRSPEGKRPCGLVSKKAHLQSPIAAGIPSYLTGKRGTRRWLKSGNLVTWGFLVRGNSSSMASPRLGAFPWDNSVFVPESRV